MLSGCHKEYEFKLDKKPTTGYENGYKWVDLGLSVKWASYNVGASIPEEYGDYIAWGDIYEKDNYSADNSETYGKNISKLKLTQDAAYKRWGGNWRMPTKSEISELVNNCTWSWTKQNGVYGYTVKGVSGNSIFLPAAGYKTGNSCYDRGTTGIFWTSKGYDTEDDGHVWASTLSFDLEDDDDGLSDRWGYRRYFGASIRPVLGA